ncbi:MAG: 6-phosphogluconolactonase [Gammaproteobacteria bacterium]|nr:6-phosphogluconolactonase [Gammaproteobacteria bacterium]
MPWCAPTGARGKHSSSRASVVREQQLIVVESANLADSAAQRIVAIVDQIIATQARANIALAGGSTPRAVYRRWAEMDRTDWNRIEFFFGDERCVAPDDPESNYRMARESLFDLVPISAQQVHRMPAERRDRAAAAMEYGAQLPSRLDLIILGIGEDGHTASLFPGSPAFNEREHKVVAVTAPKAPHERLTVTPSVILAASRTLILAAGSAKAKAVAQALESSSQVLDCPAQLARKGLWIMDRAAASGLRHT